MVERSTDAAKGDLASWAHTRSLVVIVLSTAMRSNRAGTSETPATIWTEMAICILVLVRFHRDTGNIAFNGHAAFDKKLSFGGEGPHNIRPGKKVFLWIWHIAQLIARSTQQDPRINSQLAAPAAWYALAQRNQRLWVMTNNTSKTLQSSAPKHHANWRAPQQRTNLSTCHAALALAMLVTSHSKDSHVHSVDTFSICRLQKGGHIPAP